jgi:uncharacterized OsmC-like protein
MADIVNEFSISIEQVRDYEFRVRFDKEHLPELVVDEPPPLGRDAGPNPSRLLAAAIGNCLSASLLFCMRKSKADLAGIRTEVKVRIARNEHERLRVNSVEVLIDPDLADGDKDKVARCIGLFEDFCTVTQSIRDGIDVRVTVKGFEAAQQAS